jgi:hypothetical protein
MPEESWWMSWVLAIAASTMDRGSWSQAVVIGLSVINVIVGRFRKHFKSLHRKP